jgi:hypothetical protein
MGRMANGTTVLDMRVHRVLGSGVYSDVFEVDGMAYKVFKGWPSVPPRQTIDGRRLVFRAQCDGYERAGACPPLSSHIPRFYGVRRVDDVLDRAGQSIRRQYILDCCYVMDRIVGKSRKWPSVNNPELYPHIAAMQSRCEGLHIAVLDADVFRHADPERFVVIDFETDLNYLDT